MQPGRLDDGRPDDRDRDLGPHLDHDPLPQRLGEGVDVGPAERPGAFGAGLDQLRLHPFQPASLGVRGGGQIPGLPVLPLGQLAQAGQPFRRTRLGLEHVAHPQAGLGLHPVVDGVLVRSLRGWLRGGGRRCTRWRCARSAGPWIRVPSSAVTASSIRCIRFWVPTTLVVKAWSIGGSKDTSPAQCTTMSRSAGSVGHVRQVALDHLDPALQQRRRPTGRVSHLGEDRLLEHARSPGPERRPSPCDGPAPTAWCPAAR